MRGLLLRCGHHVLAAGVHRCPLRALATSAADTGSPERAAQVSEEADVLKAYEELVDSGRLRPDPNQRLCAQRLQRLFQELKCYTPAAQRYEEDASAYRVKRSRLTQELADRDKIRASKDGKGFGLLSIFKMAKDADSPAEHILREARDRELAVDAMIGPPPEQPHVPRGIFLHGTVGSGKTMLMDHFLSAIGRAGTVPRVRRMHFNEAMDELHRRMHRLELERERLDAKQNEAFLQSVAAHEHNAMVPKTDPVAAKQRSMHLAKLATRRWRLRSQQRKESGMRTNSLLLAKASLSLIQGSSDVSIGWDSSPRTASLLCLDEMQVGDPYTAIALKGMLEALLDQGTVIVCTSNTPIRQLNRHGVHEDLFSGFQERLLDTLDELELNARQDYRLSFAQAALQQGGRSVWQAGCNYHCPLDIASAKALDATWEKMLRGTSEGPVLLHLHYGRTLMVLRAGPGVARFTFEELCGHQLGHPDYQAVAQNFRQGVLISDVPRFSLQMRDRARRFITLLDELYNAKTPLYISAAAQPMDLFNKPGDEPVLDLESLQSETAVPGAKLRRDLMGRGSTGAFDLKAAKSQHSGLAEQFAFARAVSRLFELTQDPLQLTPYEGAGMTCYASSSMQQ